MSSSMSEISVHVQKKKKKINSNSSIFDIFLKNVDITSLTIINHPSPSPLTLLTL